MSLIFLYLLKLSLSLSLVYLFYHFVLRRLTFYNWNRFYLLCYTAISFFFPFINITPVLERNEIADSQLIRFIPAVGNIKTKLTGELPGKAAAFSWISLDWLLFFALTGIVLMLTRLIIQLISFRKIINNAKLVSNTHVKLYQVNQSIIPFSFGNSIFINQQLHNDDELTEIIRHEFVHVKQKHTVDIIWTELLCILNWYNPFIWMIRKAIRQNLEFIADQKVLQSGIDRKEYQYLLLKVIGNNHFSIASQFNFSSLKKRIAMMNKMKSAKAHLIKFLFLLPLMAILILSFRNKIRDEVLKNPEKIFSLSGIVYDNKTELPLSNVIMIEQASGNQTKTDANGFYKIAIPILSEEKQRITINFSKPGYRYNERRIEVDTYADRYCLGFFSLLTEDNAGDDINHAYFYSVKDNNGNMITNPGYDFVKDRFENHFRKNITNDIFYEKGIYSLEDIKLEQLGIAGKDTVPTGSLLNSKGYFVDITGDKGNCTVVIKDKIHKEVKRVLLNDWKKNSNYYINLYGPLPVESKDSQVEVVSEDSKPVIYEVEDNTVSKEFKRLELNDNLLATVTLNNGKIEKYDLNKEADKKVFEKKYGPVISALPKGQRPVKIIKANIAYDASETTVVSPGSPTKKSTDLYIAYTPGSPTEVDASAEQVETVLPVKDFDNVEGNIILDIKGNIPENKVREMVTELKNKGYDLIINTLKYRNEKIASFKGSISGNGQKQNFDAFDFYRFTISDLRKNNGKSEFNFYIGGGSLKWQ